MAIQGYWRLNANSNDASGNGNNGTDTSVTYSQANGVLNGGAGFDGSNSTIAISTLESANLYISMLVKFDTIGVAHRLLTSYCGDANNYSGFTTFIIGTTLYIRIAYNNTSLQDLTSTVAVTTGVWYHISYTYDGNYLRIYMNSKLVGEIQRVGSVRISTPAFSHMGGGSIYTADPDHYHLNGKMDDVKYGNSAVTNAVVKNEYSRIKGCMAIL